MENFHPQQGAEQKQREFAIEPGGKTKIRCETTPSAFVVKVL